jgi:2-polyprenyl-3-methyl-5-hydroxy-6-metoxy-1,4-benzoquinol methylase
MQDVNLKVQQLIVNKKYFVSIKKKTKKDYWSKVKDPDGIVRDRIKNHKKEKNFFLQNNKDLINRINSIKFSSMCDVGCGPGYLLSVFQKKKILGIDIDLNALKIASRYSEVCKIDLNKKNIFLKRKFDLVVCYHVIEHIKNPNIFIKNIKSILKKNGTLIVGTPDFDSAMARLYKNKFRMLHDKTHISLFSRESLVRFLENFGFKIFNIDYPFFETEYFNKKSILKIFSKNKKNYSPPFFGNIFTVTCKKM